MEFGQKFNICLYKLKENSKFRDLKLFSNSKKTRDQFVISKEATLRKFKRILSFRLDNGTVYIMDNKEFSRNRL